MKSQAIALVVPFNGDGDVLLLQRNSDAHCADLWSFPGGKIEPGESPKTAAIRELTEETGLEGSDWKFLGDSTFQYPDRLLHFFLFSCHCENIAQPETESDYNWFSLHELHSLEMPEANAALVDIIFAACRH